jgi:hypothetical protein
MVRAILNIGITDRSVNLASDPDPASGSTFKKVVNFSTDLYLKICKLLSSNSKLKIRNSQNLKPKISGSPVPNFNLYLQSVRI